MTPIRSQYHLQYHLPGTRQYQVSVPDRHTPSDLRVPPVSTSRYHDPAPGTRSGSPYKGDQSSTDEPRSARRWLRRGGDNGPAQPPVTAPGHPPVTAPGHPPVTAPSQPRVVAPAAWGRRVYTRCLEAHRSALEAFLAAGPTLTPGKPAERVLEPSRGQSGPVNGHHPATNGHSDSSAIVPYPHQTAQEAR